MDILTRSPYYLTVTGSGVYDVKRVDIHLEDIEEEILQSVELDPTGLFVDANIDSASTEWGVGDATVSQGSSTATITATEIFNPMGSPTPRFFQSGSLPVGEEYELVLRIASGVPFGLIVKDDREAVFVNQNYDATGENTYETKVVTIDRTSHITGSNVTMEVQIQNSQVGEAISISHFGVSKKVFDTIPVQKEKPILRFEFQSQSSGVYTVDLGTVLNDYVSTEYRIDGTQKFTVRDYIISSSTELESISQSIHGYDGYGYFNEGQNPTITDRVLLSTNRIYTPSGSDVIIPVKSDEGTTEGLSKGLNKVVYTTSTGSGIEYYTVESGSVEDQNLLVSPLNLTSSDWVEDFSDVTGGQLGPDGTTTAANVAKPPTNANDRIRQTVIDLTPGTHTLGLFVKDVDMEEGGRGTLGIRNADTLVREHRKTIEWNDGVPTFTTQYDFGTPTNTQIESIGNGWYKIYFTCDIVNSNVRWEYDVDRRFGSTSTGSVDIWEPFLFEGTDNTQTTYYGENEEIEGRKRYTIECQQQDPVKITFVNRYGAFEDIYFTGNSKDILNIVREQFQNMTVHNTGRHTKRNTNVSGVKTMTINSGFYPEDYNEAFKQLLNSERVWMEYNGDTLPVTVTNSSFNVKTQYSDKLINYTLQVERSFDEISKLR